MKFILSYLIALFFFSLTYASSFEEFSRLDLWMVLAFLTGAFLLQFIVVWLLKKKKNLQHILLAIFTLGNIVTLNLILNEHFIALSNLLKIGAVGVGIFILYTLMNIFDENSKFAKIVMGILFAAISFNFGTTLIGPKEHESFKLKSTGTSASNIQLVDFVQKPNVYIILFDSLVPTSLMKKNFETDAAPYHALLDQYFRKFDNFFVERVPSRPSLNRLLALDKGYYKTLENPDVNLHEKIFQGFAPSPLFQIFKHNGYETSTIYNTRYFGKAQGPYLDNYLVNRDLGACEFIEKKMKKYTLFGICNFGSSYIKVDAVDFLISSMDEGLKRKTPQILVSYIYSPGHTDKTYNHKNETKRIEFRNQYLEKSEKTATGINKIISFLKEKDPTAILYLSGDHGPWMSRRTKYKANPEFYVQDRYAVFGGIFPKDNCVESFSKPYTSKFMTISQGSHMIIRCLSGGKDAFLKLDDITIPKKTSEGYDRYENYLYE